MFRIYLCLITLLYLYGCKGCEQTFKSIKSDTVGMNRVIVLYDCNGGVIQKWEGNINVDAQQSSFARFILDGKTWQISGIITIEEK